ncbi:MAG TPA: dTDP-4-dehydrorhamnose reductase [Solirubrobacteraceae bacterium]
MRIIVTGAGGMLGVDVMRAGERAGHEMVGLTRRDLDIAEARPCLEAVAQLESEAVINCAAWTDVDGAESQPLEARAVNAQGAGNLARAAVAAGVPLFHVSTDYVFDGVAPLDASGARRAYVELDPAGPRSAYGTTKLEGERQVFGASLSHTVVRTSWLFGAAGRNFVDTMLDLGGDRDAVEVVADQVGCPTWTGHLAPALVGLLVRGVTGPVHLAGAGHVSWNGFAVEIFRQAEINCRVESSTTAAMGLPARRPEWSVIETGRDDVLPLPPWQDGLAGYLAAKRQTT